MAKSNKQIIINEIVKLITEGKSYSQVLVVNGSKWKLPSTTYSRYWKEAGQIALQESEQSKKLLNEARFQLQLESQKKSILSADERKEYLSSLIQGKIKIKKVFMTKDGSVIQSVEPDFKDRLNAIAELNKMEGDYAPVKLAQTDSKGKDVEIIIKNYPMPNGD